MPLIDTLRTAARRRLSATARTLRRRLGDPSLQPVPTVAERWRASAPDEAPLRVAVIGTGRIAAAHLEVLASFDDVELVALGNNGGSDPRPLAQRFGVADTFDDAATLLDRARPDLVYVLVAVEATVAVAAAVLERGLPCLIEKPAGLRSAETKALAAIAARSGSCALVGVNRRFHSVLEHALDAVRVCGPLRGIHIEAHEPITAIRRQGRFAEPVLQRWLVANSIHAIDLFRRCAGEVVGVERYHHSWHEAGDSFGACLATDQGTIGTFTAHWSSLAGNRVALYGDGVQAVLEPLEHGEVRYADGRRTTLSIDVVDQCFKPGFYAQSAALIDALRRGEPLLPPASDLADHAKSIKLAEMIGDLDA